MKHLKPLFLLCIIAAVIGCQQPCETTTTKIGFYGDTTYVKRSYENCSDTLNYYEWKFRKDSTVISEGKVVHGLKEGEWIWLRFYKIVSTYKHGTVVSNLSYDENGALVSEQVLTEDSLFAVKNYYSDGTIESAGYLTMEEYSIGHWIEYDSLGRKFSEGDYIAEPVLTDTLFIENPMPPHDLQMTVVTENGGKHGPWILYDPQGNVTDTVLYDKGVQLN